MEILEMKNTMTKILKKKTTSLDAPNKRIEVKEKTQ